MSRGFVKEDDQEEIPMVPPRAYLPEGVINFVTPSGMEQLIEERENLMHERENLNITSENERRLAVNFINAKLLLLNNRIAEARVVNPNDQPKDEIRFGATVTLRTLSGGKIQTFRITGVDEADIPKGKLSFISPFARSLINKRIGDQVVLKKPAGDDILEITGISYV